MNWFEISAISIVVLIGFCAYFLIRTLIAAKAAFKQMQVTMQQVQQTLDEASEPSRRLLTSGVRLTESLHEKVDSLDGLFGSLEEAKGAVGDAAAVMRKASEVVTHSISSAQRAAQVHQKRLQDSIEWATAGLELWHRWQAHRQSKAEP